MKTFFFAKHFGDLYFTHRIKYACETLPQAATKPFFGMKLTVMVTRLLTSVVFERTLLADNTFQSYHKLTLKVNIRHLSCICLFKPTVRWILPILKPTNQWIDRKTNRQDKSNYTSMPQSFVSWTLILRNILFEKHDPPSSNKIQIGYF